jgi:hypothetical protein
MHGHELPKETMMIKHVRLPRACKWRTPRGYSARRKRFLLERFRADRLTNISSVVSGPSVVNAFSYSLDNLGRRTQRADGGTGVSPVVTNLYGYDPFDQLISATKTNSANGAADAAYKFNYQYDQVGNRLHEDRGQLDLDGGFNPLNQLTHLKFGGKLDVLGNFAATNPPVTVKVDGEVAAVFNQTNFLGGGRVKTGSNIISIVARDASSNRTESLRRVTARTR